MLNDIDVQLLDVQGISPLCIVNTSSISGYDGATVVSTQRPMRNITLVLGFSIGDAEKGKQRLHNIFQVESEGYLYFKSESDIKKIKCLVEKIEIPPNVFPLKAQISLLCPSPYFTDLEPTTAYMAASLPMWEFPFEIPADNSFEFDTVNDGGLISSIENKSNINVGCVWKIKALADISKPKIIHLKTYEWLEVNIQLQNGDILEINTKLGDEAITLTRGKIRTNVFNNLVYGSDFLQLLPGQNEFRYTNEGDKPEMAITCYFENCYGGV